MSETTTINPEQHGKSLIEAGQQAPSFEDRLNQMQREATTKYVSIQESIAQNKTRKQAEHASSKGIVDEITAQAQEVFVIELAP